MVIITLYVRRPPAATRLPFCIVWPPDNDWKLRNHRPSFVTRAGLAKRNKFVACLDLKDKMSISYPGKYCLETFSGRLMTVAGNDDLGVLDGLSSALQKPGYLVLHIKSNSCVFLPEENPRSTFGSDRSHGQH